MSQPGILPRQTCIIPGENVEGDICHTCTLPMGEKPNVLKNMRCHNISEKPNICGRPAIYATQPFCNIVPFHDFNVQFRRATHRQTASTARQVEYDCLCKSSMVFRKQRAENILRLIYRHLLCKSLHARNQWNLLPRRHGWSRKRSI